MPLKDLRRLQLTRLKRTIKHAYENNRFYRAKMKMAKVRPDDIKGLKDIEKIPFLSKDELREYYPFGLVSVPLRDVVEVHASSGTTGKPVVGVYTKDDLDVWSEVMARAVWSNGLRPKDRLQNAYGYGLFTGAHGFEKGAQKIGAMVIPISSGNTKRQLRLMKDFQTTALASTPSYSLYMAEVAVNEGYDLEKDFKVRIGLFGAEAWSEEIRAKIEEKWGMRAFDHYGLTEIIGPGVSVECDCRTGLHINADHFYAEVVDPKTGEVLEYGEEGELVFTSLTKKGFPTIRFRTKDIAYLLEERCECGRTLPRHSRVLGRADDMMKVKGVIVFPSQIEEALMKVKGVSENYIIEKYRRGAVTELRVKVEPLPSRLRRGGLEKLGEEIEGKIFEILNLKVSVEIVPPNSIPRSEGKARRVLDLTK